MDRSLLERESEFRWRIAPHGDMRVPGILYADEALIDAMVTPGHPSTPGYNDPAYPLEGRVPFTG